MKYIGRYEFIILFAYKAKGILAQYIHPQNAHLLVVLDGVSRS